MTTSSTPISERPEIADPEAYLQQIIATIGDQDPLEALAETPDLFAERVKTLPAETLRARPFDGKWTPLEILGHVKDADIVYGYRARTIYCDDRPQIIGMDQEKWVERLGYNDDDPNVLLDEFRMLRTVNLRLWNRLKPEDMKRVGLHNERGEESLGRLLPLLAGHDRWHLNQFDRYVAALRDVD